MRISFISSKTYYEAKKNCLWACKIVKVEGGFMCFESIIDYKIWKDQK